MKTTIKKSLLLSILLFSTIQLFAGSGHSHSVSESTIKNNAIKNIKVLIQNKKIAKSWENAKFESMKRQGVFLKEWKVSFKNSSIQDLNKQIIFIYLTTYGKIKGANFKDQ